MAYHVYLVPYLVQGVYHYYCGYSNHPARRWAQHRAGLGARCLRGRTLGVPIILFSFLTRKEAMAQERLIKRYWTHQDKKRHYDLILKQIQRGDS